MIIITITPPLSLVPLQFLYFFIFFNSVLHQALVDEGVFLIKKKLIFMFFSSISSL